MKKGYRGLARIFPKNYRKNFSNKLVYAGIDAAPNSLLGFFLIFSFGLALLTSVVLLFIKIPLLLIMGAFFGIFIGIQVIAMVLISIIADARTKFVEEVLPDVLLLISSNIRSGMTMYNSLLLSARDEFKHFKREIEKASTETLAGTPLEEALFNITTRFDSKLLKRTMKLIVEGMKMGGRMAPLLDNIANDIQETRSTQRKIRASVLLYTTLFIIAACIGAPVLFAMSLYLVGSMTTFGSAAARAPAEIVGISTLRMGVPQIGTAMLKNVALLSISINAFFGALMVGILEREKAKRGVYLIPVFVAIAIIIFFVANIFVGELFATITVT